jgi:hypothetical protein
VYIVGSYAYPGIPLLEGCVGSSKKVVGALVDHLSLSGKEEEVDWSIGRGGFIGRVWRWRSGEGL